MDAAPVAAPAPRRGAAGFEASLSRDLSKQLSDNFNPPREADEGVGPENSREDASSQPSVLSKLQKWGDYASVGEPVAPTRFVPMKTPMSREIISNWTLGDGPKHSLTVPELLAGQAAKGRAIGMIIDLANHECLYADDIPPSVEYAHVQLIAKVLPPPEAIDEVARIAQDFWRRHPDQYVAIHCAYGFNRTGFVVCAYLIQCCGLSVAEAMDSFAAARPPGVKHEKFINELYARYGGGQRRSHSRAGSESGSAAGAGAGGRRSRSGSQAEGLCAAGGGAGSIDGGGGGHLRRLSSGRGGISLAVESQQAKQQEGSSHHGSVVAAAQGDAAGGEAAGGCAAEGAECNDLRPARCLSAEADRLQSEIPMERNTSLGLAKALCEDFSMFEGTPVRPSPLQAALAQESAFSGYPPSAASASPLDSPVSPPWAAGLAHPYYATPGVAVRPAADCEAACRPVPHDRPLQQQMGGVTGSAAAAAAARQCGGSGSGAAQGRPAGQAHGARPPAAARGPSGLSGAGSSSGAAGHGHVLPPLPSHCTPPAASGGCGPPHRPVSPTGSFALMEAGGGGGSSLASMGSRRPGSRFLRSMSVESDNASLGFGARQAIMTLRGERQEAEHDQPLSLLELFDADGAAAGGQGPRSESPGASDCSECEWDEKPSSTIPSSLPSRVSSHGHLPGSTPPASVSGKLPQGQGPAPAPPSQQQPQQPQAARQPPLLRQQQRNGRNKPTCRLM